MSIKSLTGLCLDEELFRKERSVGESRILLLIGFWIDLMPFLIEQLTDVCPGKRPVEIVERKGLGHPDSICDMLSEEFSVGLSQYYLKEFGLILHHNVDKVLLSAGQSHATFGSGKIIKPIDIYLSGRATSQVKEHSIPVADIAQQSVLNWFQNNLHAFDINQSLRLHTITHPGSTELVSLFMRHKEIGRCLANDTSCGVGFAPESDLESLVLAVEKKLNEKIFKQRNPEVGEDIKVMGVRVHDNITLTIACAFICRYLNSIDAYINARDFISDTALQISKSITSRNIQISVNTGDDLEKQNVYLTVSGTSAEAGDDGETGRGNRMNGLITPMRPMCLEAVAGKNPITHVGKLYTVASNKIAHAIVDEVEGVTSAECYLVSQIGKPIDEPNCTHIRVRYRENKIPDDIAKKMQEISYREIAKIPELWKGLLAREIPIV